MRRSDSRGRASGNEAAIRLWFCEVEGHKLISRCPFNKDLDERMKVDGIAKPPRHAGERQNKTQY